MDFMFNALAAKPLPEQDEYCELLNHIWENTRLECLYDVKDFLYGTFTTDVEDFLAEDFYFSKQAHQDSFKKFVQTGFLQIRFTHTPLAGDKKSFRMVTDPEAAALLPVINAKLKEEVVHIAQAYYALRERKIKPQDLKLDLS